MASWQFSPDSALGAITAVSSLLAALVASSAKTAARKRRLRTSYASGTVPGMPLPTQASVVVKKSAAYKGGTKEWSNRYYLNSSTGPASSAAWHTLFDNIVAGEKAVYPGWVTITECIGYQGGSGLPADSKTYTQAGTATFANYGRQSLQVAALVRYTTTQRTTKNHPIYLFNYYHAAGFDTAGGPDSLCAAQSTALGTYANSWLSGFSDGTSTYKKSGPFGAVAQTRTVSPYLTHRDFRD